MTNKVGPMDHGILGKIGNKVDGAGTSRKVSSSGSAADNASAGAVSATDTVNLTSSARLLAELDQTLAALPAVDSARVAEIKTAIENGDYQIDSGAIADAMIRLDRLLGD
jgi:negative regulator of flagellin synthesis FlgM